MRRDARRTWAVLVGAGAVALVAGWGAGRIFDGNPTGNSPPPETSLSRPDASVDGAKRGVLNRFRPDFTLPDLEGRQRRPDEWDGKVLVVNFWATWCVPCRKEIPLLIDLERRRPGVRVVGIAIDRAEAVRSFVEELGIDYPVLLDDPSGSTMRLYGNRIGALPFTVIARRDGTVAFVRLGELEREELDSVTAALL